MAIEPRELEQTGGRKSAARSGVREGRRERPLPRVPTNETGAEGRRPATAEVEVSDRRRWVQRHGATVFITFVFVFLALLVVVKRLSM